MRFNQRSKSFCDNTVSYAPFAVRFRNNCSFDRTVAVTLFVQLPEQIA
jgi:hypothetical protein